MRLEMGGVGFYGDSRFLHIDVGNVRYWPRMSYAQLARVFPDGKSVLVASNGQPLPGYEEARAELATSGRVAQAQVPPPQNGKDFFSWLFGTGKSADETEEESVQQVAAAPAGAARNRQMAMADPEGEDAGPQKAETAVAEVLPVPPHRPKDFLALAVVEPPSRPAPFVTASLSTNAATRGKATDPIGDLVQESAQSSAPQAVRSGSLPTIITRGASEGALARSARAPRPEPQVLAYAPVAQMDGLRSAVHGNAGGKIAQRDLQSAAEMAHLQHEMILAPNLTGLRRAGRIETAALSQKLAAGYLARFSTLATSLPTDRFVGPAVVGLRTADRSRMVFVDSSIALKSGE